MRKRRWVIPAVALALAAMTTLAIVGFLQGLRRQVAVEKPVELGPVIVAKTAIGMRKVVPVDALELRQVPVAAIHPQAGRRVEDVVNRVAMAPIVPDEQVLLSKLAPAGLNVGLAYILPKDKRAMTIAVSEVIGVAGFVFPGDRVDVVGTVTLDDVGFTKIMLQDVEVLAIAQKVEQKPGEEPRVTTSATVALTPEQTEVLAQIDNSGKVRLALRPYGVSDVVLTSGMTVEAALGGASHPPVSVKSGKAGAASIRNAVASAVARVRPARRTLPPRAAAAASSHSRAHAVELWRGTEKSILRF